MFTSIRLINFKAWRDSKPIPLAPLTIIVGLNNSGKSSILHAILALKQTAQSQDQRPVLVTKGIIDLNGFRDILHCQADEQASFSVELGTNAITVPIAVGPPKTPGGPPDLKDLELANRLYVSFRSGKETKDIEVERSRLLLGEKKVIDWNRADQSWSSDDVPEEASRHVTLASRSFFPIPAAYPSASPGSTLVTPEIAQSIQFLVIQAQIWAQVFFNTHAIVPLRQRVPWSASEGARTSSELGAGGENLLAALGSAERFPGTNKTLIELVSDWFASKEILKRLHVEGDKATRTRMLQGDEITGAVNINVAGMGEGISQLLPIVARSLSAVAQGGVISPCILVEQPEIHLHPALQADLADLFIDCSKGQRQIIVETHSEHLVLRVRRRIAEGTLDPARVSILYVEKAGLESTVRPLNLNERGDFSDWPEGFFDQAYQEAMAMAEASMMKG